jgi:hypothetical protein
MRRAVAAVLMAGIGIVPILHAQKDASRAPSPAELTGCVTRDADTKGPYTLTDVKSGAKYRLTGKKMDKYDGKRVLVAGPGNRVAVKGGLWPSPNAAGQAGALDPAQESIARQPGAGGNASTVTVLPEFNVVRVRTLEGTCP